MTVFKSVPIVAAGVVVTIALFPSPAATPPDARSQCGLATARTQLGLRADADVRIANVVSAVRTNEASDALEVTLTLTDTPATYTLNLRKHSNRAPDMFVRVYGDGSPTLRVGRAIRTTDEYTDYHPGPVRTYRGEIIDTITGEVTGEVAGSLDKDGQLRGRLTMTGEDEQWIEPVKRHDSAAAEHIIYKANDVELDQPFTCGVADLPSPTGRGAGGEARAREAAPTQAIGPTTETFDLHCANIGCDVDAEYFQNFASVEEAQQRIEDIINIANIQYEHQVQITHRIALIVIRTEEPDPYPDVTGSSAIGAIRVEWENEFSHVDWDLVQLFSGAFDGFGFANIEGICQDSHRGFSVVGPWAGRNLSLGSDISEHEIAHNWSAVHCCPGSTMSSISGWTGHNFAPQTIAEILAYRATRPCIEQCDSITIVRSELPLLDSFSERTINTNRWYIADGVTIHNAGGESVARIDPGGVLRTVGLDTTGLFAVNLSYSLPAHPSATAAAVNVEYLSKAYNWIPLATHQATSAPQSFSYRIAAQLGYDPITFPDFQLRFTAIDSGDPVLLDDVSVTAVLFNPCPEDCGTNDGVVDEFDLSRAVFEAGTPDVSIRCDVAPKEPDGAFGNGTANIDDIIAVINAFGPCEQ